MSAMKIEARWVKPQRSRFAIALIAAFSTWPVLACGPDFPVTLLDARQQSLLSMSEGVFDFEVSRLLPKPTTAFKPVDADGWLSPDEVRAAAEASDLSEAQLASVTLMRSAPDAASAEAAGSELPADLRLYTAAAVAWHAGDIAGAQTRWAAVLDLPADQRALRGVWASYMDGRTRLMMGDLAGATSAFVRTREWVKDGAADPLGLAVASFGEQARLQLDNGDPVAALNLYAQQAALGSSSGRQSLLFVARKAFGDQHLRARLLDDDLGRQLLVAFLFTRSHELTRLSAPADADPYALPAAEPSHPTVLGLLDLLSKLPAETLPEADRLAATAYRAGRYEQAQRFAAAKDSPLSAWVRAKLSLREGRMDDAAAAFAQAARGFPKDEAWGAVPVARDPDGYVDGIETLVPSCRVQAEAGALALARGDYMQALDLLYAAADNYWTDAAYVAERVVTVDELKTFVDRVAAKPLPQKPAPAIDAESDEYVESAVLEPHGALRWLLARRLLREGRLDVAAAYVDDPELKAHAEGYIAARQRARSAFFRIDQARAWFEAATLARVHGMELLGFEGDPDYRAWDGSFDLNDPTTYDEEYNAIINPRSDLKIEGPFTSDGERERVGMSRARPLERFHYRTIAADLASRAADQLPPRSQASAAVLCEATHWLIDRQPDSASALYRRYLSFGPYVPWGNTFGRQCPMPNFDKAERERDAHFRDRLWRVGRWAIPIVFAFIVLVLIRRRQRAAKG